MKFIWRKFLLLLKEYFEIPNCIIKWIGNHTVTFIQTTCNRCHKEFTKKEDKTNFFPFCPSCINLYDEANNILSFKYAGSDFWLSKDGKNSIYCYGPSPFSIRYRISSMKDNIWEVIGDEANLVDAVVFVKNFYKSKC